MRKCSDALGFEKIRYYANEYGLGELAGYNIEGNIWGTYPEKKQRFPASWWSREDVLVRRGHSTTPLQLGAMVSAIANGGTLTTSASSLWRRR